jgi:hypothetical protein
MRDPFYAFYCFVECVGLTFKRRKSGLVWVLYSVL